MGAGLRGRARGRPSGRDESRTAVLAAGRTPLSRFRSPAQLAAPARHPASSLRVIPPETDRPSPVRRFRSGQLPEGARQRRAGEGKLERRRHAGHVSRACPIPRSRAPSPSGTARRSSPCARASVWSSPATARSALANTVIKSNARKVRRLADGGVIAGFAGATADAFTLFERLEAQARAVSGPAHPRLRRARQGLAHRPLSAPAGSDDGGRRHATCR